VTPIHNDLIIGKLANPSEKLLGGKDWRADKMTGSVTWMRGKRNEEN